MSDPLKALQHRFRDRTAADLARIEAIADDPASRAELQMLVHRMAGTAGTLGFPDLSALAKVADRALSAGEACDLGPLKAAMAALNV